MALKLLWIFILTDLSIGVSFSDSVLLRFSIDGILFRVLSDRVLYESSVIETSSGFAVKDASLGSSMLFFRHIAIFYQIVPRFFLIKNRCFVLYSLYSQKQLVERALVTSTKLVAKNWMKKYLHGKDTQYYIENICHQFPNLWMCSQCCIENILCAINFPIYICHQIPDEYLVQKQLPTCNFI